MKKWFYDLIYHLVPVEWIFGSDDKIEGLAEKAIEGRVEPGRAITLGCGVGRESILLARKGFDVTGLDFSPAAIRKARRRAKTAGVEVEFFVDDLTHLSRDYGTFDLVTDFGAVNDMSQQDRDSYLENLLPLTYPGSKVLMFCFDRMMPAEEVQRLYDRHFEGEIVECLPGSRYPGSLNLYLMTRKTDPSG